ncbi:hypothetical protein AYI69_g7734, partial [Smittium culicis]
MVIFSNVDVATKVVGEFVDSIHVVSLKLRPG